MQETLIVNPYDADEAAQAMQTAIHMPKAERIERHSALMTRIRERDACNWMQQFVGVLRKVPRNCDAALR